MKNVNIPPDKPELYTLKQGGAGRLFTFKGFLAAIMLVSIIAGCCCTYSLKREEREEKIEEKREEKKEDTNDKGEKI